VRKSDEIIFTSMLIIGAIVVILLFLSVLGGIGYAIYKGIILLANLI